jgi:DNA-binding MarR family transcriptional regulator
MDENHEITDLSDTEKIIYNIIVNEPKKELKPTELVRKTKLSARKVRTALKRLEEKDLVSKRPDFLDLRSHLYYIDNSQEQTA